jgi:hypothetical protein
MPRHIKHKYGYAVKLILCSIYDEAGIDQMDETKKEWREENDYFGPDPDESSDLNGGRRGLVTLHWESTDGGRPGESLENDPERVLHTFTVGDEWYNLDHVD